jgi:hypothetical protein
LVAALHTDVRVVDADLMPATVMLSIVLIGAGATAAAVVGLLLPEPERLSAALPLVLGAGVGVMVLAVGMFVKGTGGSGMLLLASAVGFIAVMAGLMTLWRRVHRVEPTEG